MKTRMPVVAFVFFLIVLFSPPGLVSAADTEDTAAKEEVSQVAPLGTYPKSPFPPPVTVPAVPPALQMPPAPPLLPENRGAFNPRTGEHYIPSGRGVFNPRTGEYYPPSGNGYINPRTGEYYPPVDQNRDPQ